jgi:catechol 2,3-dioxygenase-like lactoylglutathione lyase family enzyme
MNNTTLIILSIAASFCIGFGINTNLKKTPNNKIYNTALINNSNIKKGDNMKLGAFSVSLNVKDLTVSKQFYQNLGFKVFAGGMEKHYLIMKNENALIGLFNGMFKGNILTFNPGWDENASNIEKFDDVRDIQKQIKSKGIKLTIEADENTVGPASIMATDPDGNIILIDQHR